MKRYLTILVLILCSCNNSNEKSIEHSEMERLELDDAMTLAIEKPYFTELSIIEEKLQDSYDLVYLSEKNKDFQTALQSSSLIIQNLILDSLNSQNSPTITDVNRIGHIETINDSTEHINFSYTLKQHNSVKIDSLKAIIKKHNLTIEGQTKTAIKIEFTSYKD
ncbi:hypothetical protein [Winogradskyella thalassocola]|uniref:Uncharacterized protein n=1 Tax=Winogradskyella thalassocola TaxID=262004 RepID=A0A1G8HSV0_9FLAO|nr:hypothetical protein [Winogradskyella thalassocola]SDI09738.1 hypothetical protein SAMN04489796_10740 [Winogradskyella thalassocola]